MNTKLHTVNIPGNLHDAASAINAWGWADYLVALQPLTSLTVAVFRMPAAKVHELRAADASFVGDVHFDDYTGPADPYAPENLATQPSRRRSSPKAQTAADAARFVETTTVQEQGTVGGTAGETVDLDTDPAGTLGGAQIVGDDEPVVPQFIRNGMSSTVASDFAAETNAAVKQEQQAQVPQQTRNPVGRPRKNTTKAVQGEAQATSEGKPPAWATVGTDDNGGDE